MLIIAGVFTILISVRQMGFDLVCLIVRLCFYCIGVAVTVSVLNHDSSHNAVRRSLVRTFTAAPFQSGSDRFVLLV